MIYFLYSFFGYLIILIGLPLVYIKSLFDERYRYHFFERLGFVQAIEKKAIWFHAASVGEVLMALPIIKKTISQFPDFAICVSTLTPSGHQTVVEKLGDSVHSFLAPLDSPLCVDRTIAAINPQLYVIFETELWPVIIKKLNKKGIPVVLLNGRISPHSLNQYRFVRFFYKNIMNLFSVIAMQSHEDAQRIVSLGTPQDKISVMGNMKFDRTIEPCPNLLRSIVHSSLTESPENDLVIFGSIREHEVKTIVSAIKKIFRANNAVRIVLTPRHLEQVPHISSMLNQEGLSYFLRTATQVQKAQIMILDTYGELSSLYSIAAIVFIGGSLSRDGGQNMLEPAFFSKAVIFGPHFFNFQSIGELMLTRNGAILVSDEDELVGKTLELLNDADQRMKMGQRAFSVFQEHSGAVERAFEIIETQLDKNRRGT